MITTLVDNTTDIFDKNFLELPNKLNSRSREKKLDTVFHHFSGKFKPWSINGVHQAFSENFHNYYKEIYSESYLVNVPNFKNGKDILVLVSAILISKGKTIVIPIPTHDP